VRSDGESEIVVQSFGRTPSEFPELQSELDNLRVRLSYRRSERLTVNLDLRYERFATEDWALQGVAPGTIPAVLSLGAQPYDYDVFVLGLGFRYRIGGDD